MSHLSMCCHSTFDDPGVLCAMLPLSFFWTENIHKGVRWTLCAKEICYSNWLFRRPPLDHRPSDECFHQFTSSSTNVLFSMSPQFKSDFELKEIFHLSESNSAVAFCLVFFTNV
eukprot:scaffold116097_cov23-Prasinocladus_malaysianus.AAC.1